MSIRRLIASVDQHVTLASTVSIDSLTTELQLDPMDASANAQ